MPPKSRSRSALLAENADLQARLEDAEEVLRAIRSGDVDALVIQTADGDRLYTLQGQDAEASRFRGEILAQVGDAVLAVDVEERITYLNAAAERLYGFDCSKALGRPLSDLYGCRWPSAEGEAAARTALGERGEWRGRAVHVASDGREIDVEVGITALREPGGKTKGMLAVNRDVSEQKRDEDKVLVSESRYRRLFEAAQDGVLILDPVTREVLDVNPFMTAMLGSAHDQIVGKKLCEIGLLEDEAAGREMTRQLQRLGQVHYPSLPLKGPSGPDREVEVVANLYDEDGRAVVQCHIRDITERRRAEEHASMLMAEVNHRAKNLLAVVQVMAHQSAKYGDPATFNVRLADRIDGLAAGQDLLVKNQWQGVEVLDLVEIQLAHFKDLIGTRVRIDGPRARLTAAAAQGIGMALHELATNAAKYGALSNSEGHVRVAWAVTAATRPTFSMSWLEDGGPKVAVPTRKGFGQIVIGRMAAAAVDGSAESVFREAGLRWSLTAPSANALMPTETGI